MLKKHHGWNAISHLLSDVEKRQERDKSLQNDTLKGLKFVSA